MFVRGYLFLVPVCASAGLLCLFVSVGVVGVFGALKSPFRASRLAGTSVRSLSY